MTLARRDFFRNLAAAGAATAGACACCAAGLWSGSAKANSTATPIRPPGALPEADFLATCIRCMRCVDACPNHAIESTSRDAGRAQVGTPKLHLRRQACMLCSRAEGDFLRCTEVCPTGALQPVKKEFEEIQSNVRMGVAKIDLNLCYSYNNYTCGTCFYACPMGAIKVGLWERPEVLEDACVGCGLCERACIRYPQAIRIEPIEPPSPVPQAEEVSA